MGRNRFTNPATGAFYDWEGNHSSEQAAGRTRNITHTAPTGGVGLVRQQGAQDPYVLKLEGTLRSRDMHKKMWQWFQLCDTQTIYFTDFDGQQYEVQIIHYEETRVPNLTRPGRNPNQFHWTYVIELEVYSFRSGDMHDVGVTP